MGMFEHAIEIAASPEATSKRLKALVDTGATYTWVPASVLHEIGVSPTFRRTFVLADGREIERDMGTIHVRIDGREHPTPCIFGEEGTDILLGVVTLEELGLGVDPVNRTLIPVKGRLAAVLRHRIVPATEPTGDPYCRLTREDGQRRQADTNSLFASLAEQRETGEGNEFVFTGDRDSLWHQVSLFVDEEAVCCPFFTFEQTETADGVVLRIAREETASQ